MIVLVNDVVKLNKKHLREGILQYIAWDNVSVRRRGRVSAIHHRGNGRISYIQVEMRNRNNQIVFFDISKEEVDNGAFTIFRKKKTHPLTKIFR